MIIFGITDEQKIIGISNPIDFCLNIENQINDSIKPRPDYSLKVNVDKTISLFVKRGNSTPYRYNGKAYKRNDTSTIEVDEIEEKRLIMLGLNISFEEIPIEDKELSFSFLEKAFITKLELSSFNLDVLKSLNLFDAKNGFNNAAKLLSDSNDFPGIDIAVFGNSFNIFKKRIILSGASILKQYYDSLEIYKSEYIVEKIENGFRKKYELVPFDAFRETIANAIVHRVWDINANTKVEMHLDKIIISSPGGLVADMTKEDYINGYYSYLRNPIIANVFRRLEIIEAFATGIKRINGSYKDAFVKPIYNVTNSAISVTLPIIDKNNLNENEKRVLISLEQNRMYSRNEIEKITGFSKDTLIRILNSLIKRNLINKTGNARSTYYAKR